MYSAPSTSTLNWWSPLWPVGDTTDSQCHCLFSQPACQWWMLAQYFPPGQTSNHGRYLLPWLEMVPRGVGGFWDIGICFDDLWLRLLLWNGSAQLPTLLSYWKFGQSASQPDTIFGNPGLMLKDWGLVQILPHWTHWSVEYIDTLSKSEDGAPFFLYLLHRQRRV